jgi:hypothetical protein
LDAIGGDATMATMGGVTRISWALAAAAVFAACGTRVPAAKPAAPTTVAAPTTTTASPTTAPPTTATPAPPTTSVATAKAEITANWEKFFQHGATVAQRIALLQNGEALRQAVEQNAANPLQQQATAKVTNVTLTSPTTAAVTYDVYLNGKVALPKAQGMAVLDGGTWKVAQASFCSLVSLSSTAPVPGCS